MSVPGTARIGKVRLVVVSRHLLFQLAQLPFFHHRRSPCPFKFTLLPVDHRSTPFLCVAVPRVSQLRAVSQWHLYVIRLTWPLPLSHLPYVSA